MRESAIWKSQEEDPREEKLQMKKTRAGRSRSVEGATRSPVLEGSLQVGSRR